MSNTRRPRQVSKGSKPRKTQRIPANSADTAESQPQFPERPPQTALDLAKSAGARASHRDAPFRSEFIRGDGGDPPPLAVLLRSSSLRLRLYVSLVWFSGRRPYDTSFPASAWAELLALRDPMRAGAKRVTEAIAWLDTIGLVEANRRQGRPARVVLLHESGSRQPYTHPGEAKGQRYVQLESSFFENQWLTALSGPAIAAWLVLLDRARSESSSDLVWVAPGPLHREHGISSDTWTRGTRELNAQGLVSIRRQSVRRDAFSWRRVRNAFYLHRDRLQTEPTWS